MRAIDSTSYQDQLIVVKQVKQQCSDIYHTAWCGTTVPPPITMAHSITRGSLDSSIQDMEAALEGCSFIAIDFEMTGIGPWRQDQADTAQVSGVPVQINFHSTGKTSTHRSCTQSLTHSIPHLIPSSGVGRGAGWCGWSRLLGWQQECELDCTQYRSV